MTPMERLLAEELPTGLFGDSPEQRPAKSRRRTPTLAPAPAVRPPDPNAAAHCAALPNPYAAKTPRTRKTRHLRALPPAA